MDAIRSFTAVVCRRLIGGRNGRPLSTTVQILRSLALMLGCELVFVSEGLVDERLRRMLWVFSDWEAAMHAKVYRLWSRSEERE